MRESNPNPIHKILFTPGPLTTSPEVKQAMLRDLGSRDHQFIDLVCEIRAKLVALAQADPEQYEAIPMQGSGTFAVESTLTSVIPPHGRILLAINGAYGQRMAQICHIAKINHLRIEFPENQPVDPEEISRQLKEHPNISHIGIVHCETTTGMINPIAEIGQLAAQTKVTYIVDAMSSFGGIPISMPQNSIDFLISSANKCIGGVPGFGFILAKREALLNTEGLARSLSLDLFAQWKALQNNGQFRFTPPTHSLLAFHRALLELEAEGGIDARYQRYRTNQQMLVEGMRGLGFTEYLPPELQGPIITSFNYPQHPNFCFQSFYDILNSKNFVIYPGKVSRADCFRIGHIGHIFKADIAALLQAIKETMSEMNIK